MRYRFLALALSLTTAFTSSPAQVSASGSTPHLEKRGDVTQLIVDGQPYLMLGAEIHNSSSSSLDYMEAEWPHFAALGMNTVLTPLSWDLVEPTEGKYDFTLVDGLLAQARKRHLHIVFL